MLFPIIGFIILSLGHTDRRFMVPFIAIFLLVIGIGIYYVYKLAVSIKIPKYVFYLLFAVIFFIMSFSVSDKARYIEMPNSGHILMKETGLWMRKNLSQKEKVVVNGPYVPYYFYENNPNNFSTLIYSDYETLIRYMKYKNAKYLTIFSWHISCNPIVKYLFEHRQTEELELLKSMKRDDFEALVYRLNAG